MPDEVEQALTWTTGDTVADPFRHEAFFYAGRDEYATHAVAFVRDGLSSGEAVLVAVPPANIEIIRETLGAEASDVTFRDMSEVGQNPLRIIPMWREFLAVNAAEGRGIRGIGEPIWAGRTPEELLEAQRHESLINLAFTGAPAWIMCPYDVGVLDESIAAEARRSHPTLVERGNAESSPQYAGLDVIARPFDRPLPEPPPNAHEIAFARTEDLPVVRRAVASLAERLGLDADRAHDLIVAVNEVTTNSVRHGATPGSLRAWLDGDSVVVEVRDGGRLEDPLAGRHRPPLPSEGGLGLWIVGQLCDLVQIRSFPHGSVVRMHMSRTPRGRTAR